MMMINRLLRITALWLILLSPALASQATVVTPGAPLSMATLASFLNSAFLSVGSCNSGNSAPTNGPGGAAFPGECWINTSANPWVFNYTVDGTHWSEFGTLNTSTFVFTPYSGSSPALVSGNNLSDVANTATAFGHIVQPSAAATLGGVKSLTCGSHNWFVALSTLGVFTCSQPAIGDISGWGAGVASALGTAIGSAGSPVLFGGAAGTPSSMILTNATGLPFSGLPPGASDTVLGYWGSATLSAIALPNCSNAMTYNTGTHLWGCNTSAGTGTVTSIGLSNSYGINITGSPVTSSGNIGVSVGLTYGPNSLGANVALNTSTYTDGPSIAQGGGGTWYASGHVTLANASGASNPKCKLSDGTTVVDSGAAGVNASTIGQVSLSGVFASPVGNIRISCLGGAAGDTMDFNFSGNSKDSTITVVRIQ